jgi:hypothetical protein
MAADSPPAIGAKGGKCNGGGGGVVRGNCQSGGPWMSHNLLSMGWPSRLKTVTDLVEDNLATLVSKRAQTDEGMGKRGQDMARHC